MRAVNGRAARALRSPRAAGAAGVVFALLLSAALVLARIAIPGHPSASAGWLGDPGHREAVRTALGLVPFAGVSFLWFMGAVRDHIVHGQEDRFFDALLLGSGLLFMAVVFVLSAWVNGLIAVAGTFNLTGQWASWELGRHVTLTLLASYAMRMAAVFTLCATTVGHRVGVFPRWLTWLGYLAGLVLLFLVSTIAWSELVFPAWVLALSGHVLWSTFRFPGARTAPGNRRTT
ncbi:hypothetical protein ACFOSC_15785 [Streptantibioticus rubrisoli]|uniref:DUF4386 family protein n=1 Tax=Streptantibioticus rubrisoli TaxID=1387313 RepID=A0ABT1PFD2_9ACTN|nr:hypothetical protein [Streptantibioticus rubrisoli]MCQ4044079.1 hypothetical protein [Streptantibioticus rubrisoli]